ncbi:protein slowmo [Trichuris trichiura]|uniref:Protein slowmo n=1 Tax=Trichuris trichiura TaxID=36087 RepID=A0A077Z1M8_TRITR|nr:protein slowmo [Trichuris trichiura]
MLHATNASTKRDANASRFNVIHWLRNELPLLNKASWVVCEEQYCGPMNYSAFANINNSDAKVEPVKDINPLYRKKKTKGSPPLIYQTPGGIYVISYPVSLCKFVAGSLTAECAQRAKLPEQHVEMKVPFYSKLPKKLALKQPQLLYRKKLLYRGLLDKYQEWSWSVASYNQQYDQEEFASFTFNDSSEYFGSIVHQCNSLPAMKRKLTDIAHVMYILSDQKIDILNDSFASNFSRKEACSSLWTLGNSEFTLAMDNYIEESSWISAGMLDDCIFTNHTMKIVLQRDQDEYTVKVHHTCAGKGETFRSESVGKAKCWHSNRAINCKVTAMLICQDNKSTLIAELIEFMKIETLASNNQGIVKSLINEWACEITYFQTLCSKKKFTIETSSTNGRCSVMTQPRVKLRHVNVWYSGITVKGVIYLSANFIISLILWAAFQIYRDEKLETEKGDEYRLERKKSFENLTEILERIFRKDAAGVFLTKLNSDYLGLRLLNRTMNTFSITENSFILVNKDIRSNDLFVGMLYDGADPSVLWCFSVSNNIGCIVFLPENSDIFYQMLNCLPLTLKTKRSIVRSCTHIDAIGEQECNGNQYYVCEIRRGRSRADWCFLFLLTNWSVEFFDKMPHRQFYMPQLVDQLNCNQKTKKQRNMLLVGKRHAEIANFIALLYGGQMCMTSGQMNAYKCALYSKTFITDAFTGPTSECQALALHYGLHVGMGGIRTLDCIFFEEQDIPKGVANSLLIRTAQAGLKFQVGEKVGKHSKVKRTKNLSDESNTNAENRSK